jgi:hypothetical protein
MNSAEEIVDRFRPRGVNKEHGPLYLSQEVAQELVDACSESDVYVGRIETLRQEGNALIPRLDLIFDCYPTTEDWGQARETCNSAAQAFLVTAQGANHLFCFVLVTKDKWNARRPRPQT